MGYAGFYSSCICYLLIKPRKIHHMLEEKGFDEKLLAKGDKIYKIEDIETNDEAYEE